MEDEEPKSILDAIEVAGLVGILRQLGDLVEFSAEVFNGIQEEVTVTASRCQKLTSRVKRIESALSPLEKAVLSQTSHIHFAYTTCCEWHPRIRNGQRHFVQSDLPLCLMETYEQCRDPPPLHLLDRFDAGGPGSCLRKYSDPTFFRKELSKTNKPDDVKVQRDQAHSKRKKKRLQQRNICSSRPVSVSTSEETNGARLSFLTDDKQATSESTSTVHMPRSSNMQDLSDIVDQSHLQGQSDAQSQSEAIVQSDFQESSKPRDSITGSGYIEYVINQIPVNKPDVKLLDGFMSSLHFAERKAVPEGCIEVVDENILYSPSETISVPCATIVCDEKKETFESRVENINKDEEASEIHESKFGPETPDRVRQDIRDLDRTYSFFDEVDIVGDKQSKSQVDNIDGKPGNENQDFDRTYSFIDKVDTVGDKQSKSQVDGIDGKPRIGDHDFDRKYSFFDEVDIVGEKQSKSPANSTDGRSGNENEEENKSEQKSEADEFLDARNTIESESESEQDGVPKPNLEHYFGDISTYCSEDANNDNNDGSEDIPFEPMTEDPHHDDSLDEYCSYSPEDANRSCFLSDPVCGIALSHDEMFQKPREFVAISPLLLPEEAVSNEVREEPVSAHTLLAGDYADGNISFEEPIASCLALEDDMPAENILPEEHIGNDLSLVEAVPHDKSLPEESVAESPSLAEVVLKEKILPEKPLPEIPSLVMTDYMKTPTEEPDMTPKAAQDDKCPPDFLDSTTLSVAEGVSQEQISAKEFVGIGPCLAETVPDERFLSKTTPIEKVLPEKPLEAHHSMAELPKENIWQEKSDASCVKAAREQDISAEVDSKIVSVAEVFSQGEISLDEIVGIDKCMTKAVHDESTEEPVTTCLSSKSYVAVEKFLPEEPLEMYSSLVELCEEEISHEEADDATHPSFSQAVSDEKVSPEVHVAEAIPPKLLSLEEEFVGIDPCLREAVFDETTCLSLEVHPSLEELTEEKILQEEELDDTTHPSFSEAGIDEKISPLEGPGSTYPSLEESVPHEKTSHEKHVDTNPFLELAVPNEWRFTDEPGVTSQSLVETVSKQKNLPEEPLPAHPSLAEPDASCQLFAEASFDENLSGSEALGSTSEAGPHNKVFFEEPVDTDMPLTEAVVDEYISSSEAGPHNKTLPKEPVAMNMSLAEAVLLEKISDPEARGTATEDGPHNKTSPEEHVATVTNMSLAEVVFDEKIPDSVAPDSTTETGQHNETFTGEPIATSLEEPLPNDNILPKEPAAGYLDLAEGIPDQKVFLDDAAFLSFAEAIFDQKFSPDDLDSSVEPISIWSNGGLLGLAPSKPPVFAGPNSVSEHLQNEINEEASVLATRKQESSSKSVEHTEKGSLSLVPSNHTSQQQSNMLNGSPSHLQSTTTSFKVFGLSHKLRMACFRGNSSSTCKFESTPTTSYVTEVAAIEVKARQTLRGSSFEEQFDYESSLFGSPTSSPPVEHMKISFNPVGTSPVSKLKLRIPCQSQRNGGNADMFPSFQLIPEASNSDDDDNSDIFCQSSPCVSDNCLSDSELWESDESPRRKYVSSLEKNVETRCEIGSFSGSFLDLPCFDAVDHQYTSSTLDQDQEQK